MRRFLCLCLTISLGLAACNKSKSEAPQEAPVAQDQVSSSSSAGSFEMDRSEAASRESERKSGMGGIGFGTGGGAKRAAEAPAAPLSSNAAVENGRDTARKFVRTAELRFRCNQVIQATYAIEEIVARNGGYVGFTELRSNVYSRQTRPYRKDSVLELSTVEVVNSMTVRVPNTRLDTVLREISPLVRFLDSRTIRAEDVGRELVRSRQEQMRLKAGSERLQEMVHNRPGRLYEAANVDERALERDAQSDAAALRGAELLDQVQLSTIQLSLYQRPEYHRDTLAAEPELPPYHPPFWSRLGQALENGWYGLLGSLTVLARLWPLALLVAGLVALLRLRHRRKE